MSDLDEFSPDEIAAAERLDAAIDQALAGRPLGQHGPELALLATAIKVDPPPDLGERVEAAATAEHERRMQRLWRPFRYAAGVLAYLFISQGIGNLIFGDWVAEGVGEDFSPHAMREGAFALIAVGAVVAAGALYRRFAPVAAISGVPLAILLGIGGIAEIGQFAAGAVLHLTEGLFGLILAGTFWWMWRDRSFPADE